MLEKAEYTRYSRQIILPEIGITGQLKLKSAKILVVGAGGLGCPILQYLTAAGIGELGIIDDDHVDLTNLHRQILYSAEDIGKAKVLVAKIKLNQLNPDVKIITYTERFTATNASMILDGYDLVIDGSDNFETRYLVNDTCKALSKPTIFGSIFKFEGYISVFNYFGGPEYRDVFPEPPNSEDVPNCGDIGVLGILPGIVGLYMANEAIKIVCGVGETLSGQLMTINPLINATNYFTISKPTAPPPALLKTQPVTDEIDLQTLNEMLSDADMKAILIDVREAYEYEESNMGGTNIPLYELLDQADSLQEHQTIIFVCQTGQRSKMAVQLLKSQFSGALYRLNQDTL